MTPSALKKSDISLLNKTLFKLALPRIIIRSVVIAVIVLVWLWAAQWLLNFGNQQDYSFLNTYSTQVADYLNSINKYIWWGLVLIGSVIVYFVISAWLESSIRRAGNIVPKQEVLEKLIPELSPSAKEVLIWVWKDQREPITVKNLYDTRDELRAGRVNRLAQIKSQRELLGLVSETVPETVDKDVDQLLGAISLDLNENSDASNTSTH